MVTYYNSWSVVTLLWVWKSYILHTVMDSAVETRWHKKATPSKRGVFPHFAKNLSLPWLKVEWVCRGNFRKIFERHSAPLADDKLGCCRIFYPGAVWLILGEFPSFRARRQLPYRLDVAFVVITTYFQMQVPINVPGKFECSQVACGKLPLLHPSASFHAKVLLLML